MTPLAPHAPARSIQPAHLARYQLATFAAVLCLVRWRQPQALSSVLTGGLLVALNLQLSRAMLPLLAYLRGAGSSAARQMAWVGLASGGKLLVQLVVAAVVLLNWPPETRPFMWGLATFLGGLIGATCHSFIRAARPAPSARHPEPG